MILVTGAGGKTGQAVIRALGKSHQTVKAFIHHASKEASIRKLGVDEVVIGDMEDLDAFRYAAKGATSIYHICPNMHPNEVAIGENAIQAAKDAGIAHFVYHSVLQPQIEGMPHHLLKMRVEEKLIASGLPFTILQPTAYMQNILGQYDEIKSSGIYTAPYSVDTRITLVDLEDVAQAAATVLTQTGHLGATYELCSSDSPSQIEIAALLSEALNQVVQAKQMTINDWQADAQKNRLGKYQIDTLIKMFEYYQGENLFGNSTQLKALLGREPTSLKEFLFSSQ